MAWEALAALAEQAATAVRSIDQDGRLLQIGAPVTGVLVIADGEVELSLPGMPPVSLGRRGPGSILGTECVLTGAAAGYSAVATRPCRVLELDREALLELVHGSREFAQHFLQQEMEGKLATQAIAGRIRARSNLLEAHIAQQATGEYGELIGPSRVMANLRQEIAAQEDLSEPLLVTGEPGVGKELIAANIHLKGRRRTETFIELRAPDWKPDAWRDQVEMAAGGTILITEIDALPPEAIRPVAELCVPAAPDRPRLIATYTERSGQALQIPAPWNRMPRLRIPALRERKADIPELARAFLRDLNPVYGATDEAITSEAMRLLIAYPYLAANVAELKNVITHAAHLAGGEPIRPEHVHLGEKLYRPGRPLVGVALGGGVVRGMAHIGVLEVLMEESIPVDMVAGTSVGSLVGAAFAGGMNMRDLERVVPTLSWPKLVSPSWPRGGMLNSAKLGKFLESLIGGPRQIEDLPIAYAAVAVDQDTGDEVIIRHGPISSAVRASAAIPGLFQPIQREGRRLIDGGLVNNVPASVVRSMGADVVIAVDVRDYNYFSPGDDGGLLISFLRGYDIMIHRAARSELEWADVPIMATKPGVNPYGFKAAHELIEAGREQAREALPAIRAALRRAEVRAG